MNDPQCGRVITAAPEFRFSRICLSRVQEMKIIFCIDRLALGIDISTGCLIYALH